MSPGYRRVVAAMMAAYVVTLAAIVFWPNAKVQMASVHWMYDVLQAAGFPDWLSTTAVEFLSNILLFVPLSLLGSLLWRRWSWVWWTLAGFAASLMIETAQFVQLPDRSPTLPDLVANTLGALLGALLVLPVLSRLRAPSP